MSPQILLQSLLIPGFFSSVALAQPNEYNSSSFPVGDFIVVIAAMFAFTFLLLLCAKGIEGGQNPNPNPNQDQNPRTSAGSGSQSSTQVGRDARGDGGGPSEQGPRTVVKLQPKADGSGFELEPSKAVVSISKQAYMSRMTHCWPKWGKIPDHVRASIWQDFLGAVDLQEEDTDLCQRHWTSKMCKNYRDTMNAIKKSGKKPDWMGASVWEAWVAWWNSDEFKMESERNSANKNKNPIIIRGGSQSFQHHREDLEREHGGPVSYMDVFAHTHATKQTNEDRSVSYTWSDDKGKFVEARAHMLESSGRESLTTDEEDAIFDSVMHPTSRNRHYDFENQQATGSSQNKHKKAQDKEEIKELRAVIAELQEQDRRRGVEMAQLNQRLGEYVQQHGVPPLSGGSGADDDA